MAERRPSWWSWAATAAVAILSSILSVGLVLAVQHRSAERDRAAQVESDRRWCALLTELDIAYQGPPAPKTEFGRKVAKEIHRLRTEFGCTAG